MPKQRSNLSRYVHAVLRHGLAVWTGAAVTALAWLTDHLVGIGWLGPATWWLHPTPLFYGVVFGVVLAFAQYLAWSELYKKYGALRRKLQGQVDQNRQMALAAVFDLKFGPGSNVAAFDRFGLMAERFQELEAEMLSGNYSRAVEVLALKDIMLQVLRGHFAGGAGYSDWADRLFSLVESVEKHYRLQAETLDNDEI
jgi:hypothetical protein